MKFFFILFFTACLSQSILAFPFIKAKPAQPANTLPQYFFNADSFLADTTFKINKENQAVFERSLALFDSNLVDSAYSTLRRIKFTHPLSQNYQAELLLRFCARSPKYKKTDSILNAEIEQADPVWRSFFVEKKIKYLLAQKKIKPADSVFVWDEYRKNPPAKLKLDLTFLILRSVQFTGKPHPHDTLLTSIFSQDPLDPRVDSLYQLVQYRSENQPFSIPIEMAIAQYERSVGKLEVALARCQRLDSITNESTLKPSINQLIADLYFRMEKFPLAIKVAKTMLDSFGYSPTGVLVIARSYNKLEDAKNSTYWYNVFMEKFPKHSKSSEIYWVRGWDAEQAKEWDLAMTYYAMVQKDYPSTERAKWANFRMGLINFKIAQYYKAARYFEIAAKQNVSGIQPAAQFWQARSYRKLGKKKEAYGLWRGILKNYPTDYYSFESIHQLNLKKQVFEVPAWASETDTLIPGDFFALLKGLSGYRVLDLNAFECPDFPLSSLMKWGLSDLAEVSFKSVYQEHRKNPWFLFYYALELKEVWGEKSFFLARALSWRIPAEAWARLPREVLELMYPKPYSELVNFWSRNRQLDPHFVYGLMRQESGFEPAIASGAGAIGLMQIIPPTGRMVAKKDSLTQFDPSKLRDPAINIRLGTRYIADLLKDHKGNLVWVLCNYNAGPNHTKEWKDKLKKKKQLDLVEDISFWETRDYVKKVLANYQVYQTLYAR